MAQTAQPADITAVQDILKEVYTSDTINSQIYDDALLYSQLEKTTEYHDAVGDKAIGFVKVGRNVGVSSRSLNGGTLGAPGRQKVDRWSLDYTATYLQIKILGTTIAKMKTARQAAVRAVDHEVSEGLVDWKKDVQRQLYGNGDALIAQCAATTASTTVNLQPVASGGDGFDAINLGHLSAGMYIDIGTTASENVVVNDAKISSVNASATAPSIVIDSAVTTTTSHYVSRADNRAGTTSYESNGLRNVVSDTGTFATIDPTVVPEWKATVTDAAQGSLTRGQMQAAFRNVRKFGGKVNLIITSLEQQEAYYNLLQSQVRFAGDSNLASGKVEGPTFNNIPVAGDPDCYRGDMYFLDTKHLFMVSAGDPQWQNVNTGGDILDWVKDEDAFQARAAAYLNLGTTKRRAHARIKSLNPTP